MVKYLYLVMFFGGGALTTVTILALGADQCVQINPIAQRTSGNVILFHVDKVRSSHQVVHVIEMIKLYPLDTKKTVIFFSSPQVITFCVYWNFLVILARVGY